MDVEAAKQNSRKGEQLQQKGKLEQAIACFNQAIELHPDFYHYYYQLGEVLRQQNKLEEAKKAFRQAIAFNTNDSWSYHALGEILDKQKETAGAINCYQQAITLNPNFSWSYYNLARIFQAQNKLELAKNYYQQAIELEPNIFWSHYFLAQVLAKQNKIDRAIIHYQTTIELNPKFYDACYQLARYLQNQGRLEAAIKYYFQGIKLNQKNFKCYYYCGETLIQLKRFTEAISCYESAIELQPENLQAYFYLGQALIHQGEAAIANYRSLATNKLRIFQVNLELGLAQAWQSSREFSKSIECCQRAIEIDPTAEIPFRIIQYIPLNSEDLERVITFYQKISQSAESSPLLLGNLGDILTKQSRIDEAIDCYRASCYKNTTRENPQLAKLDWQHHKQKAPDFIIIGATKCGTTSLFYYLQQHPKILVPHKKEINFFNHHFELGVPWYLAHFPAIADSQQFITGEASPFYLYNEQVIARIKQLFPETKLIAMLRNPIERTISEYYHSTNHGLEHRSLAELITLEQKLLETKPRNEAMQQFGYLLNGIYVEKIAKWMASFPAENILILKSESFFEETATVMEQVWQFLDVPPQTQKQHIRYNVGSYPPVTPEIKQRLQEFFIPYNRELEEYLGRKFNWD